MSRTLTVEGDITAADTRTVITTQGSVTAPSLVIPRGVRSISKIIVAACQDGAAAGSAVFILRLGGSGVLKGEQAVIVGAAGIIAVQAGADGEAPAVVPYVLDNADIDVSPSDTVTVAVEMAGSDLGTSRVAVTLVFA